MKYYLLSVIQPDGPPPSEEVLGPIMKAVETFIRDLRAASALVISGNLEPAGKARVVRAKNRRTSFTDGPYLETKELLGGLCIIKTPDAEEAMKWAEKAALATTLPIEIRAFWHTPEL